MTDLILLQHSLGLEYFFHPNGITITQRGYAYQMLINFGYTKCNATIIPMHFGLKLKLDMEGSDSRHILIPTHGWETHVSHPNTTNFIFL
jgi:hypothetical protein